MKIHPEELTIGEDSTYWVKEYEQVQFTSPRHYHFEYELAYIKAGVGKLFIGSSIYEFKTGDLFLFAPKLIHAFKNVLSPNKEKAVCKMVLFKQDFFGNKFLFRNETVVLRNMLEDAREGLHFIKPKKETLMYLESLPKEASLNGVNTFIHLLNSLSEHKDRKKITNKWFKKNYYVRDQEKILRLLYHIHANLEDITFRKAAEFSSMRESSFARLFKSKTERTFSQYLNEARVKKAQGLLLNTSDSIQKISSLCGFNNLSYFNRIFKKITSLTPMEFRNKLRRKV